MNILALADLHTFRMNVIDKILDISEDIDLITMLGDISESYFLHIKEIFPTEKKVAILGNHDYPFIFNRHNYIENIHGKVIDVNGIKIGGIEGSYRYKEGNFPGMNHQESLITAYNMGKADILISHTSPFGIHEKDNDVHSGLMGISAYLDRHQPILCLHGHQHNNMLSLYCNTAVIGVYGAVVIDTETCDGHIYVED